MSNPGSSQDREKAKKEVCKVLKNPLLHQTLLGFSTGAVAGVGVEKVGDWVGYAVAGTVAFMSLANELGLISIKPPCESDADEFRRHIRTTVDGVKDDVRDLLPEEKNKDLKKAQHFIVNNSVLAGFFFLGFAAARSITKQI